MENIMQELQEMQLIKVVSDKIGPEGHLENEIISDTEFLAGAVFSNKNDKLKLDMPVYHIADIMVNIDALPCELMRDELRLIALMHDTFAYKVDKDLPISLTENNHSVFAAEFAKRYLGEDEIDQSIIKVIKYHEVVYLCYLEYLVDSREGLRKAFNLYNALGKDVFLYNLFMLVDEDDDKGAEHIDWWFEFQTRLIAEIHGRG